jgi:uncharacterized protein
MGYVLRMSGEIRDWLAGIGDGEPRTATAVVHALIALAREGPDLGPPTVVPLDEPVPVTDPREALDYAYQERLEQLHQVRRSEAERAMSGWRLDADQYASIQAEADAFRIRKETLKARYASAVAQEAIAKLLADIAADEDEQAMAHHREAAAEQVSTVTADIDRELGREPCPGGLFELRPTVPGDDVRLIFAVEPADAVLLISALEGHDAVSEQHVRAVEVSAEILRQVRAGQDPEASAVEFADGRQLAEEFVVSESANSTAGASTVVPAELTVAWLPFQLVSEGYPPCDYQVTNTGLIMTSAAATDMFVDPAGAWPVPDAGRLVGTPPDGDFRLAAQVTVDFGSTYDAGALLLHAGERLWAKLCLELSPQRKPVAVTVVTRGTSDDCNSLDVSGSTLWLRITRSGTAWAFHASTDGDWWRLLRYFSLGSDDPVKIGFLAQSPKGQGCTAAFERISFLAGAPSDLRDGS